jgi:Na+-driven multidrug efflux pump
MGFGFTFYGISMVMMAALNGAGDTRTPTWINFVGVWLFQIPLAYVLSKHLGLNEQGAFWAIPIAESSIALVAWWFFSRGYWKKIKV